MPASSSTGAKTLSASGGTRVSVCLPGSEGEESNFQFKHRQFGSPEATNLENKCLKTLRFILTDSLHDFYIPNEDVAHYFCAADIVVQPYLSATQSGVSMVAYNFNKPMVLTNVGGLSEYVNDKKDGYLVDVKPEAIVSALKDYYVNKRESQFVAEIKNKKSSYSWKNLAGKFDSLYNNLNHE